MTLLKLPTKSNAVLLTPTYLAGLHRKAPAEAAAFVPFSVLLLGERVTGRLELGAAVFSIQPVWALET